MSLDVNHQMNIGPNQASIRYVEKVTITEGSFLLSEPRTEYPFGQVFYQHEHALVTVDNDCRVILWDQYGDNKEQQDVEDALDAVLAAVLCLDNLLPIDLCSTPDPIDELVEEDTTTEEGGEEVSNTTTTEGKNEMVKVFSLV